MSDKNGLEEWVRNMRPVISKGSDAKYVEGRRSYIRYRDLGVKDASNGHFNGVIAEGTGEPIQPTGWHYHDCVAQLTYVLDGWARIEFEDGTVETIEAGDAVFIPGGVLHTESDASENIRVLEYTIPGEIGTVPAEPNQA